MNKQPTVKDRDHWVRIRDHNLAMGTLKRAIRNCEMLLDAPSLVEATQMEVLKCVTKLQNVYKHMENFYVDIDGQTKEVNHVRK